MLGFKLFAVAAALASAVAAVDVHDDSVCLTAPAVTVTVTVSDCVEQPSKPIVPASSGSAPAPPPQETTVPVVPTGPSAPAPSGLAPSVPASPAPASSGPEKSTGGPTVPTGSSASESQSHQGSTTPTSHSAEPTPPATVTSNAAVLPTAFPGIVAAGVVFNAAIAVLV